MAVELRNIVESLENRNAGKVLGIAGTVSAQGNKRTSVISANDKMDYKYAYASVCVEQGIALNTFNYKISSTSKGHANAICLLYEDGRNTVANINRTRSICVSADYSGCIYSVYNAGGGIFKCVHTSKGSATDVTCINGLRQYAATNNWVLVYEFETRDIRTADGQVVAGVETGDYNGTYFVTRADFNSGAGNVVVRTLRIRHNSQFNTVSTSRKDR